MLDILSGDLNTGFEKAISAPHIEYLREAFKLEKKNGRYYDRSNFLFNAYNL